MLLFLSSDGVLLAGHEALSDTMKDIIVDALAALLMASIGYSRLKAEKWLHNAKE